ncbi:ribonuclease III [Acidicapsa ligni]|uniref:ribonuclease III n=1 Tax=Acidicapsa ligni TaxID=542300 RepID=UPI0021DFE81F|nr:ribonuclease III [Acidicapsa ligni]
MKVTITQPANLATLETALGHAFARPDLLVHALTHRSQAYELAMETAGNADEGERADNERLEFLGDAVLGMVVAEALYANNSNWQEGQLTRLRAQLVSRRHMAEVAQAISLGDHLRLGKGEERSGGRKKAAILANAMEAVIAALYLDAGLESVRQFARRHILGEAAEDLARELNSGAALGDHKSALQEHLQATHLGVPVYMVEGESGPDHRKRFQVELRLRSADGELGDALASGIGSTKKKAEQEAARRALIEIAALAAIESVQPARASEKELAQK